MIDSTACLFDPLLICNIIGIRFVVLRFLESNCLVGMISMHSIKHTQPISELSGIDINNTLTICECRFELAFGVIVWQYFHAILLFQHHKQLKQRLIIICARIIKICDVFDMYYNICSLRVGVSHVLNNLRKQKVLL